MKRAAPVTVTKPGQDPEVVPARRFKRRSPTVAVLGLTTAQRHELFRGGHPRVVLPRSKPLALWPQPGDVYDVPGSKRLWIGVIGVEEGKEEDILLYKVYDERPRLLRASPHGLDFDSIRRSYDDRGVPKPLKDAAAVAQAAEESAYTTSPGASLRSAAEEISREAHDDLMRQERQEREERIRFKIARANEAIGDMEGDEDFKDCGSSIRFLRNLVRKLEGELLVEQREVTA